MCKCEAKMTEVILNQSGTELGMQDGGIGSETRRTSETWKRQEGGWTQEYVLGGKIAYQMRWPGISMGNLIVKNLTRFSDSEVVCLKVSRVTQNSF